MNYNTMTTNNKITIYIATDIVIPSRIKYELTNFMKILKIRPNKISISLYGDSQTWDANYVVEVGRVNFRSYSYEDYRAILKSYMSMHFWRVDDLFIDLFRDFIVQPFPYSIIQNIFNGHSPFYILGKPNLSKFFCDYPIGLYLSDLMYGIRTNTCEYRLIKLFDLTGINLFYNMTARMSLLMNVYFNVGMNLLYNHYISYFSCLFAEPSLFIICKIFKLYLETVLDDDYTPLIYNSIVLFYFDIILSTAPAIYRFGDYPFHYLLKIAVFIIIALGSDPKLLDCVCKVYKKHNKFPEYRLRRSKSLFSILSFAPVLGGVQYILSGGESNPGPPVFSRLVNFFAGDVINNAKATYKGHLNTIKNFSMNLKNIGMMSVYLNRLFASACDFIKSMMTGMIGSAFELISRLSILILNLYETHKYMMKDLGMAFNISVPEAGDSENFLLGLSMSAFLPKELKALLRDIPIFTSMKVLDDLTWIQDLLGYVVSLPRKIFCLCSYIGVPQEIITVITSIFCAVEELIPFSNIGNLHYNMVKILEEHVEHQGIHCDSAFQEKFLKLQSQFHAYKNEILSMKRVLPTYFVNVNKRFEDLGVIISYARTNVRVEPVCIVFDGPPGCGKSTLMAMLATAYKDESSIYVDVPTDSQKKHFYDTYQGESIYMVDDMGQKAVSQWGEVINQVSTVKYKLECARAELKDTKSFVSKLMLLSTNHIPTQQQLGKDDGIMEIEALYRRIHRFNMSNVKFVDGKYSGCLLVEKYDSTLGVKKWIEQQRVILKEDDNTFNLTFIDEYIRSEMEKKIKFFELNTTSKVKFGGLPKSKPQGISSFISLYLEEVLSGTILETFLIRLHDIFGRMNEMIDENYPNFSDWCEDHNLSAISVVSMGVVGAMCIAMLAFGAIQSKGSEEKEETASENHVRHYTQERRNVTRVIDVLSQSVQTLLKLPITTIKAPPQLMRLENNMVAIEVSYVSFGGKTMIDTACALISGDIIIIPYHLICAATKKEVYITVVTKNSVVYDKMCAKIVNYNMKDDIAFLQIPPTAPRYFKQISFSLNTNNRHLYLLTPTGVTDYNGKVSQSAFHSSYTRANYTGNIFPHDFAYDDEYDGMCGSWIVNGDGALISMHVAATLVEENGVEKYLGIGKVMSLESLKLIINMLKNKIGTVLEVKEIVRPDFSGVVLNRKSQHFVSTKNTIVPSMVHGIYPELRKPADVSDSKQIHILSQDAFQVTPHVDIDDVEFAADMLEEKLSYKYKHNDLTEFEIVKGNDILNRIEPTTSPGIGCPGKKSDYLDYEKGTIKDNMKEKMIEFCDKTIEDRFEYDTYYATTFKVELRNVEQNGKVKPPRLFQAGPLLLTIFYRILFGNLIMETYKNKFENGIMIGINPLGKEWEKLANRLTLISKRNLFDGDFKWYDKKMHPIFQRQCLVILKKFIHINSVQTLLNNILNKNYDAAQIGKIVDQLLELIISTPTIMRDIVVITTHNQPSGMGITAFFNSCIHLMYTGYVYSARCKELKRKRDVSEFIGKINDFVYGDDKLCSVHDDLKELMDPFHFARIIRLIGLDFTPADKGEWRDNDNYTTLDNVTFLKRSFIFHPKILRIVGPLEERTMTSTLNYIKDEARDVELTNIKLLNFQREAFLHYSNYKSYMNHVSDFIQSKPLNQVKFLSEKMLVKLYEDDLYDNLLELR